MSAAVLRPESAKERERNLLAVALQGDPQTACRIIVNLTEDDLTERHGRWLLGELARRVGLGHQYHDIIAYADEEQAQYLDDLQGRYVTSGTADMLLADVKAQARLRKAKTIFSRGLEGVGQGEIAAIEEALTELAQVVAPGTARRIHNVTEILQAAKKRVEDLRAGRQTPWIRLGMPMLERVLAIQPGQLVILGAATGVGKTALALSWTYGFAFVHGNPTLYLNSEMGPEEIGLRLVSIGKGLHHSRLRIAPREEYPQKIDEFITEYGSAPALTSEPIGELTSAEVVALTRYHRAAGDLKLLVVDYIQRLRDYRPKDQPQWQMLMEISQALKALASDQGIVVLCLAQFNSMGELAASKGMANDADLVLGLERCGRDAPAEVADQTHQLTIVKGRHVPTGLRFCLRMDPQTLRFTEVLRPEERVSGEREAGA